MVPRVREPLETSQLSKPPYCLPEGSEIVQIEDRTPGVTPIRALPSLNLSFLVRGHHMF